jgi:hypothetical protein
MQRVTTGLAVALASVTTGCGGDTPREVAEKYVEAVESQDWDSACEVSARDSMHACIRLLRKTFAVDHNPTPSVKQTEAIVEEIDGRRVVNFEFTVIR